MNRNSRITEKERKRDRDAKNAARADARAIEIPQCANQKRRNAAISSLWDFGQTYFASKFYIEAAPVHRDLTTTLEKIIRDGGNEADVLPRGSAKTTWMEIAVMWAVFAGLRKFVVLVAGTGDMASGMLDSIKAEIETNEELAEDFPEICFPIRELDGIGIRGKSMTLRAQPKDIPLNFEWKRGKITFPAVPDSPALGAVIRPVGIEGNLRGLKHKTPDGKTIRPDLVLIDDPQTRESASSPHQVRERLNTINGDILGLAGPRKKIAAMVAATIIQRNDVADQLTDRKLFPVWQGRRVPMVSVWPVRHEDLWMTEYAELRKAAQRAGDSEAKEATAFYVEHRAEMDNGASVYWPARFNKDEASALQHAYNLLIDYGRHVFFSEYQNDPQPLVGAAWEITPEQVCERVSNCKRGIVPEGCGTLSLGCDVNLYGISWVLTAYTPDAAGYVIDYGKFPAGESVLWKEGFPYTEEQAIFNGLMSVFSDVIGGRVYTSADTGERVMPSVSAVDCSFKRDAVFRAVQSARMKFGTCQFFPIRGLSTKTYRPMNAARKGDHWHIGEYGPAKALFANVDLWRERMQKGFLLPIGSMGGSLSLYGSDKTAHALLADHITAEQVIDVLHGDKLGMVYVWQVLPGRKNDLADALTYTMAAASYAGVHFGGIEKQKRRMPQAHYTDGGPHESKEEPIFQRSKVPARRNHASGKRQGGFVKAW